MFEWNIGELLMIAAVGIFLFSPKEIPRLVVSIVRFVRNLRNQFQSMIHDLEKEFDGTDER